jgi:hypothetical protein
VDGRWRGCQRAKLESVKDHEGTSTHKEAANPQMNQSDMKEAVKTAILQHDHVLLNLTSIILSMAKNHDSLASFPAQCLADEMLSVEVKTKGRHSMGDSLLACRSAIPWEIPYWHA